MWTQTQMEERVRDVEANLTAQRDATSTLLLSEVRQVEADAGRQRAIADREAAASHLGGWVEIHLSHGVL